MNGKKIIVHANRCPQNHHCPALFVCPVGALKQDKYKAPTVDESICIKCGKCVKYCGMGAIKFA